MWIQPKLVQRNVIAVLTKTIKQKKISQNELHRRTGIAQGYISRMLRGDEFDISLSKLIDLCNGLGCHPNDFIRYPVRRRRASRR